MFAMLFSPVRAILSVLFIFFSSVLSIVLDLFIGVSLSFVLSSTALGYTALFRAWYFGSITDLLICLFLYRRAYGHGGFHFAQNRKITFPFSPS